MYSRLSSFDEVAKAYDNIKPIQGGRANQDLRPLRERRYWWNRIKKVNDNKYLMSYRVLSLKTATYHLGNY